MHKGNSVVFLFQDGSDSYNFLMSFLSILSCGQGAQEVPSVL